MAEASWQRSAVAAFSLNFGRVSITYLVPLTIPLQLPKAQLTLCVQLEIFQSRGFPQYCLSFSSTCIALFPAMILVVLHILLGLNDTIWEKPFFLFSWNGLNISAISTSS